MVLARDVKAIESLSKLLMPFLVAVILFLVYQASQTPGWDETKDFFFQVDWSRLLDTGLWGFAFGQAFYTLAIGQGYLVTYGSYIPRKTHVPRACVTVACVEISIALLAGWMIFPFVFSLDMSPGHGPALATGGGNGVSILLAVTCHCLYCFGSWRASPSIRCWRSSVHAPSSWRRQPTRR